jgi:HAD superfamily hydrolase (TIGR01509 family)
MPLHFLGWRSVLDSLGCPFTEERFYEWGGVPPKEIIRRLNEEYQLSMPVIETAHSVESAFGRLASKSKPIEPVVREALRFHGIIPMAVASSGARPVVECSLETINVRRLFDVIVVAADVPQGKPEPDVFLLAAEKIGVNPSNCVVYEDTPAGLEAARRAGMSAVDITKYI